MTAVQLLRELIALPSINPAFVARDHPGAGEKRVAEFVAATSARAGLDVELDEVLPNRPNVLARLSPADRPSQRIILAPHLDTVGGDAPGLWQPRMTNGRLHGRGACDTKGSLAVMLTALSRLARSKHRPHRTEIVLAGLIDEENGQAGSRALAASGLSADLAIVGEPTQLAVVTAHKGDVWLQLESRGRAAHGAQPELGRNAVHSMARIVDLLSTRYATRIARTRHPLLGRPTVNVGMISGGTQPNIVPDRCAISVDRRTLPGETEPGIHREIRSFLSRHALPARLLPIRSAPCPPLETDPRQPLVQALMRAARQRQPVGVHYFCDAAVLAAGGIPSVVLGPGNIAQAHTRHEWIAIRQLDLGVRLLTRFMESLP